MGTGASISICSLSSVKVKHGGNKIGPEPQRIFGSPLDVVIKDTTQQSLPLVVQHTVEYLEEFGLNHKGLFRINGSAAKIRALRLKYDQGEEVDLVKEGDINSVAGLLKLFLNQLPTAVFPEKLCTDIWAIFEENKNCTTEQTRCLKSLFNRLPEAHSCLARFLIRFLAKVAANSDVNQMTLENLAIVFGPTLFRIPCSPLAYEKQTLCNAMLLHMLQHHKDLFLESPNNHLSPMEEQFQIFHPVSPPQELTQPTEENEPPPGMPRAVWRLPSMWWQCCVFNLSAHSSGKTGSV
ncbi:protein FAM13A-like isoform X2 [Pantherophis guttatus]|uniref:Protein FAM13A-like isoform X2 n=1 Tax=Pantherophis guttatus TaxID=94885 RepID=A0A6P9DG08_PANGU|nr:protein FAM13A-like isoform X2 [Pantherophis guttatus]